MIHTYSRAEALADGVLVAADPQLAREAGWKIAVAYTSAVHHQCIDWTDRDTENTGQYQDRTGREWDVLYLAMSFARANQAESVVDFDLFVVSRALGQDSPEGDGHRVGEEDQEGAATRRTLRAVIGPGDHREPVLTIMLPTES